MTGKKYSKIRTIRYRRQREFRTNYKKRLNLLILGLPRIVIRKSSRNIVAQVVEYDPDGDKVIVTASAITLSKFGWKYRTSNIPSAYLTGYLLGVTAKNKKVKKAILDLGLQIPKKGGKLFAVLKGALDAGLDVTHNPDALPSDDRLFGEHITNYFAKKEFGSKSQFSKYVSTKSDPANIKNNIDEVKKNIDKK